MSPTVAGVLVILVVGIAVVGAATLADWHSHRRAQQLLHAVPDRGEALDDLPAPDYVTDTPRATLPVLDDDERRALERDLDTAGALTIAAPLADDRLATTREPLRAIVRGALVLVCPEGIGSAREVTEVLARASAQRTPLALFAPTIEPQALDAMAQNTLRGLALALSVRADAEQCALVAEHTGATGIGRADLQSGWLPDSALGRALVVVAGQDETVVVADAAAPATGVDIS